MSKNNGGNDVLRMELHVLLVLLEMVRFDLIFGTISLPYF